MGNDIRRGLRAFWLRNRAGRQDYSTADPRVDLLRRIVFGLNGKAKRRRRLLPGEGVLTTGPG